MRPAFLLALVLVAVNLRAPFVAVAPISGELRRDLATGGGGVGLLTSLPVLCFGLLAPVALLVIRRAGAEAAVTLSLTGVVVGSVIRSAGSFGLAVAGTLVIGLGITIGNVVLPVLIRRESPPDRAGLVTGVYVTTMNLGSMVVSLVTAPLADLVGWRLALGVWGALALAATAAWLVYVRRSTRRRAAEAAGAAADGAEAAARAAAVGAAGVDVPPELPPWRTPLAWLLGLAFAGQATSYYATTAWLPTLLSDEIGLSRSGAGAASAVFQVFAVVGAFGVPLLATRIPSYAAIAAVGVLWMTLPVLLLVAPQAYLLGGVLGGIAQGGGFAAIFTVVVQVARTDRESARLSAFVQGTGYVVAATGPTVLGLAHDITDAWTVPMLIVLGTTAVFTVLGTLAGRTAARA